MDAMVGGVDAMTNDAKQGGGVAYRLGWVLYWACFLCAGAWAAFFLWWAWVDPGVVQDIRQSPINAVLVAAPSLILYGLGRAFRYVLSRVGCPLRVKSGLSNQHHFRSALAPILLQNSTRSSDLIIIESARTLF